MDASLQCLGARRFSTGFPIKPRGASTWPSLAGAGGGVKGRGAAGVESLTLGRAAGYHASMRTLITGGVKSGKSRHALELALEFPAPRAFLATAVAFDEEMRGKIARHRAERGDSFDTVEEPLDIHKRLVERMVLDCVPLWLNNIQYYGKEGEFEERLSALIAGLPRDIVIVTNEVGSGFVPPDPDSRRYGNLLGEANARLAAACDRVVLMVAGLPLRVK